MGACIVGGIFEGVLGMFLKPLRRFFPAIVTGSVVIAIGLSLLGVGINYFCGGSGKADYGSLPNLFLGFVVLIVIILLKHFAPQDSVLSSAAIFVWYSGRLCGGCDHDAGSSYSRNQCRWSRIYLFLGR